jgi:hypothetical protein
MTDPTINDTDLIKIADTKCDVCGDRITVVYIRDNKKTCGNCYRRMARNEEILMEEQK